MGTDVVLKAFGGVEAAKKYAAAAYAAIANIGTGSDGKPILRLTEDGDWIFGQDETPLHKTDLLAINPASFRHGFIAFDDKGVAFDEDGNPAEILLPIVQPLPYKEDLPALEEPRSKRAKRVARWQDQLALDLIVVDGKNKGAEMVYKPTSVGGLRMCGKLIGEVARRLDAGEADIVPLVELFSSFYFNRTWGKEVAVPEHAIVEWKDFDDGDFVATTQPAKKSERGGKGAEKVDAREKTRRGDPVDSRRSARRDDDENEAPRGRRAARRDDEVDDTDEDGEPRRTRRDRGVDAPTDKVARIARESRAARRDDDEDELAPRGRRGRAVDEPADEVEEDEAPRRSRRGRDEDDAGEAGKPVERRARRGRDDDSDDAKPAPRARRGRDDAAEEVEDDRPAPRRARRDDDEVASPAGPRGRAAAAGGRRAR